MKSNFVILSALVLTLAGFVIAQPPQGHPPGGGQGPGRPDWPKGVDADKNGSIDAAEFQAAIDRTFAGLDKNGNGVLDPGEVHASPRGENGRQPGGKGGGQPDMNPGQRQGPPMVQGGGQPGMNLGRPGSTAGRGGQPGGVNQGQNQDRPEGEPGFLPPFFFMDLFKDGASATKADFDRRAKEVFASMDANHDGVLSREESRPPKGPGHDERPEGERPPPPNAMFIAAELRFGDKLVTGQPFSADTVIEDTHRLFDGTTVTKKNSGSIYRDGAGRTRREQPLDMVGNFAVANDKNKPQTLVFINDFSAKTQYFVDLNNKVARKSRIGQGGTPPGDMKGPPDAKSESLGTKTIEGVSVEGTRVTFDIPVGQIGNDKPIQVVTENWYSPELQVLVMSRHTDPLAGEHVFRLVNIKRSEPAADLFSIPAGYRIENQPERGHNQ